MNSAAKKSSAEKQNKDDAIRRLPGLLREIAEATSYEVALAVARVKGGQRVYLRQNPPTDHWLSHAVGHETAIKICREICPASGGLDLDIPVGRIRLPDRKAQIEQLTLDGAGKMKIAEVTGLHYRTVQKYRSALRAEGRIPEARGARGSGARLSQAKKVQSDV
jgi:hypothetical protein